MTVNFQTVKECFKDKTFDKTRKFIKKLEVSERIVLELVFEPNSSSNQLTTQGQGVLTSLHAKLVKKEDDSPYSWFFNLFSGAWFTFIRVRVGQFKGSEEMATLIQKAAGQPAKADASTSVQSESTKESVSNSPSESRVNPLIALRKKVDKVRTNWTSKMLPKFEAIVEEMIEWLSKRVNQLDRAIDRRDPQERVASIIDVLHAEIRVFADAMNEINKKIGGSDYANDLEDEEVDSSESYLFQLEHAISIRMHEKVVRLKDSMSRGAPNEHMIKLITEMKNIFFR